MIKDLGEAAIKSVIVRYLNEGSIGFERLSDDKGIATLNLACYEDDVLHFVSIRPFTKKKMNKPYELTARTRNAGENQAVKWLNGREDLQDAFVTFDVADAVILKDGKNVFARVQHNVQHQLDPEEEDDNE